MSDVNCRWLISASRDQLTAERLLLGLLVLRDPPEDHHADAGEEHGDAVDERPEPGVLLRGGVVEDLPAEPDGADAVTKRGERDVPEERHPVLVERDEADDDEEVEVRLDAAAREQHEGDRAEHQAAGDEERGPAAVGDEVAENQADQGGDHGLGRLHGGVAECQPETHQ